MQTSGRHRPRACLWIDWWSKRHKEKVGVPIGVHFLLEVLVVNFNVAKVMSTMYDYDGYD